MENKPKDYKPAKLETREIELPKIDVTQYIGKKAKIATAQEYEGKHGFFVRIETDIIDTLGEGQNVIELRASKIFGLQTDKDGVIGWGKDTKLGVFLAEMKVQHYNDLKGREVIVQTQLTDGRKFLTF